MPLGVSRYSACVLVIFSDAREDRSQSADETPPATAPIACRLVQQLRCSTMRPRLLLLVLTVAAQSSAVMLAPRPRSHQRVVPPGLRVGSAEQLFTFTNRCEKLLRKSSA